MLYFYWAMSAIFGYQKALSQLKGAAVTLSPDSWALVVPSGVNHSGPQNVGQIWAAP